MIIRLPDNVWATVKAYNNLQLGGKNVPTPYFINSDDERGGLRVLVGKGSPEEIEHEVKVWAQLKGFDLNKASIAEIREFMIQHKIGVDCSGYLVHVLNRWMKQNMHKRLIECLKFKSNSPLTWVKRRLRSAENIGANTLTNEDNTKRIEINDVRPGDLIRLKGLRKNAHHIAMVSEVDGDFVGEDKKFIVKSFKYIHSHRNYEDKHGVRSGEVVITNPGGELKDQDWREEQNGKNWVYEGLLKEYNDNGLRRLNCLAPEVERNFNDKVMKATL